MSEVFGNSEQLPYTPTTEEVRRQYSFGVVNETFSTWGQAEGFFDRWLAEVKAQAWEEGWKDSLALAHFADNPYRQGEGSGNSNSQPTAETATYLERERIRANIIERVQDLSSCHKNDNCQELGALIASYIEEWIDEEEE